MANNAFISFFDKADGESIQKGKEKWIEINSWNWEVQAESSWTKGGGASVGKPNPGKISFEHFSRWERMAIVSDEGWVRTAYDILGHLVVHGTIKTYPLKDLELAKHWVSGPLSG